MLEEIADAVLDKVKHFTIGFARAGETPAAKGSGVLIKHGELHGILTCAHVDKYLRELKQPVGSSGSIADLRSSPEPSTWKKFSATRQAKSPGPKEAMTSPSFTYRRTLSETLQRTASSLMRRKILRSLGLTIAHR